MTEGAGEGPRRVDSRAVLLAIETSSEMGSVALGRGRDILSRAFLPERGTQAARLMPSVAEVLGQAGLDRRAIEGVVVGRGPGSFTGVRIAAASARGLARGLGIPLWSWSSLASAAAAWNARIPGILGGADGSGATFAELSDEAEGQPRFVLFDARAERLYGACYRFRPGQIEELSAPAALTLDELLAREIPENVLFCGDGAHRHAEVLEREGFRIAPYPLGLPTAEGLLRVHGLHPGAPPEPPGFRWEPDYLRPSQPERESGGGDS